MSWRPLSLTLCALVLAACGSKMLGERDPAPPPPASTRLDHRTEAQALTLRCQPAAGLLAVGSEGTAWFEADGTLEAHRPDGRVTNAPRPEVGSLTAAHAIGPGELVAVDEVGRAWVTGEAVAPLHVPAEAGTPQAFCGDPREDLDGHVLTDLGLHERSAERWWHLDPAGPVRFGGLTSIATRDGACRGPEGDLYVAEDDYVWRLADEGIRRIDEVGDPSVPPTRLGPFVASASVDTLWLGSPEAGFAEVDLPARAIALAGAGDHLWVAVGPSDENEGSLFLLRGTDRDAAWARATHEGADLAVDQIFATAAGSAWLQVGDELCHAAYAPTLVVEGLRAHGRVAAPSASLRVQAIRPDGAMAEGRVSLERDGAPEGEAALVGGIAEFELPLGDAGWHDLTFRYGDATRGLPYRVVQGTSWGATVEPIARASCATEDCHAAGSSDPPDLSTFESWVEFAPSIRGQVVTRQMPRDPGLPLEEDAIVTIVEWIEGGMHE